MSDLNWEYSERQAEAEASDAPFLLYGGAKGGGKSFWLCRWAFTQAVKYSRNKGFLGRQRGVDFNNTTLETWKKAIPGDLYRVSEQRKKIYIKRTGSVIDFGGMDKEEEINKFNSAEYGFIGLDQAEEIKKDNFAMLRGTLRHKLPDGRSPKYLVRLTANPAQCWLKDDFILKPKKGHVFIKALPTDNPFLADGYIENLAEAFNHREDLLAAYLEGSWEDLAGNDLVVQPRWVERSLDLKDYGRPQKRVVVCDPAHFGDDETVIYVIEETSHAKVINSEVVRHKSLMDTAGRLQAKSKDFGANLIIVDGIGIGAGVVDALNELDANVLEFKSSRKPTVDREAERFANLRAQIWMQGAKKIFEQRVIIPDDDILRNQLTSVKFNFLSNGRVKIESKDDIKQRLGNSPDRADAFFMGLYGLDLADRLDAPQAGDSIDRAGMGRPVDYAPDYEYCFNEY